VIASCIIFFILPLAEEEVIFPLVKFMISIPETFKKLFKGFSENP